MTKICSKCKIEKELSEFHKHAKTKDGLRYMCRNCRSTRRTPKLNPVPNSGFKYCSRCKEQKEFNYFYPDPRSKTGLTSGCRPCLRENHNKLRATPLSATAGHRQQLRRKYGKDLNYDELILIQDNKCASCGTDDPGKPYKFFQVDHDHACCPGKITCGKCIRGLLCNNCNTGISRLDDSVEKLKKAIIYIENWHSKKNRKIDA